MTNILKDITSKICKDFHCKKIFPLFNHIFSTLDLRIKFEIMECVYIKQEKSGLYKQLQKVQNYGSIFPLAYVIILGGSDLKKKFDINEACPA